MLKRILASMAITSLLLASVLLVYWWRASHGYSDSCTLGGSGSIQSHFFTQNGRIFLETTDNSAGGTINSVIKPFEFRNVLGYFLIIPGLWLAIKIRSWLPRPPGVERRNAE